MLKVQKQNWPARKCRPQLLTPSWPCQRYKLSVNVDKKYKVIRKIVTDTASTHDSQHFDAVLDTANTSRAVYADRGYPSEAREAQLKKDGFRNHIQRKGHANKRKRSTNPILTHPG